jgi:hypothetical protein
MHPDLAGDLGFPDALSQESGRAHPQNGPNTAYRLWRFYADISKMVTVGYYRNSLDNPFPWVSGIVPIEGANAYGSWGRGNDKWGVVLRFTLQ